VKGNKVSLFERILADAIPPRTQITDLWRGRETNFIYRSEYELRCLQTLFLAIRLGIPAIGLYYWRLEPKVRAWRLQRHLQDKHSQLLTQ
jgi:hypothetical protein